MQSDLTKNQIKKGALDGIPIGIGYFAVSFSLGIAAGSVGLNVFQGFLASLLTLASAGEYAAFKAIGENASYIEMAIIILVTNCRYLLMSFALSQQISPSIRNGHRMGMSLFITDEIFGVSIIQGKHLMPSYVYGLASTTVLPWALGTAIGIAVGNILPAMVITALSMSLYGMFIAIFIPVAKKNPVVLGLIIISFVVGWGSSLIPFLSSLSESTRVVLLTVAISVLAAVLFPVDEGEGLFDES